MDLGKAVWGLMETFWMYFQNQDRNFGKGYSACRFCYKESKNHKSCHHESISIAWVPVLIFSCNIGNASKLGLFLADKTGGKNQLTSADVLHLCEIRASPTSCWMARTPSAIVVPADCYTPPATKGLYTPLCLEAPTYLQLYSAVDPTLSQSDCRPLSKSQAQRTVLYRDAIMASGACVWPTVYLARRTATIEIQVPMWRAPGIKRGHGFHV